MWPDVLAGRKVPLLSGSYPIRLIVFLRLAGPVLLPRSIFAPTVLVYIPVWRQAMGLMAHDTLPSGHAKGPDRKQWA